MLSRASRPPALTQVPRRRLMRGAATLAGAAPLVGLGTPLIAPTTGRAQRARPDRIPETGPLSCRMLMNGDTEIGHQTWRFEQRAAELVVTVTAEVSVDMWGFISYSFDHTNTEVWRDGQLQHLETETVENDERFAVTAEHRDGVLVVEGNAASYEAPPDTLPGSYWRYATVDADKLIDTQTGELVEVTVSRGPEEQIPAVEGEIRARRYDMSGDVDLTLWYTPAGALAGMAFSVYGADITYERRAGPPFIELAWDTAE